MARLRLLRRRRGMARLCVQYFLRTCRTPNWPLRFCVHGQRYATINLHRAIRAETWFHKGNCLIGAATTRFHRLDPRWRPSQTIVTSSLRIRRAHSASIHQWHGAAISRQELMRLFRRFERCILRLYIARHQRINASKIIAHRCLPQWSPHAMPVMG